MSYTNQVVSWEAHKAQDMYGDMEYEEARAIAARKQAKQEIVKTAEGTELLSKSYFYVDPRVEPNAFEISKMDKLDGELIVDKYVMFTLLGRPKMLRFITV